MRLVPIVRATLGAGDYRVIPLLPFLPLNTASERLYPVETGAGARTPNVSGEGNPVLAAVQALLASHERALLESYWTVESADDGSGGEGEVRRRRVPARLDNVLNLQSLTMMMDLLLTGGLVLHATRARPGGHERVQIVLRARRDPHRQGYAYLESIAEGNNVRYWVRLGIKNKSWSKTTSGGVGNSGVPDRRAHHPQPRLPGRRRRLESKASRADFQSWDAHPEAVVTQATEKGGYQQTMEAQRDTFFVPGRSDRYGGDVALTVSLTKTWQPSSVVNVVGMNLPHYFSAWLQDTANQRREGQSVVVALKERVLIPHAVIHHETMPPELPDGIAAIEEVPVARGRTPGALKVTVRDLLDRRIVNLGYDHEKLQVLFGEVMAKLAGNERPLSGQRSHAVTRLTEHGTRAQDALRYMLSFPMFSRYLDRQLDEGMTMPGLVRPGGAWTDTHGELSVQVELARNPHVLGYVNAWVEAVQYGFDEQEQHLSRSGGWALGATGGAAFATENRPRPRLPRPTSP